jgi:predicted ribosomally synthesized peptide with SipW-like signal peptide
MSDDAFEVSRRKLIGAMMTVGGAGAIGGASTTAFFSDEEEFANNQVVAGDLDLKIDWEEHYSDWSDDEGSGLDVRMSDPGAGYTSFPSAAPPEHQSVWIADDDVSQFMANTAIEAFPDDPDAAEGSGTYDAQRVELDDELCALPADTDEVLSHPARTRGTFPAGEQGNAQTTEPGDPLIDISDVKPGDFGEVTFSFHLCGNPGYLWLTGALRDASENGTTEPERKDPDEDYPEGDTVELLQEIRTAFWYDTGDDGRYGATVDEKDEGEGDNVFDGETFLPLTGSLGSVLTALEDGMVPLEPDPVTTDAGGDDDGGDDSTVTVGPGDGSSLADEVIVTRTDSRFQSGPGGGTARNYRCADYEEHLDVGDLVGTEIITEDTVADDTTYSGCTDITVTDFDDPTGTVTLSSSGPVLIVSVKGGPDGEHVYVFDQPVVLDEVVFTTPGDHQISNIDVCCPVGDGAGGGGDPNGRQCFPNSTTAYVGFEWWLPLNHGNEVQTDSVSFDLGFYAEQCRHNDGSMGNT